MRFFGYSTGAIALGGFSRALNFRAYDFQAIELSALRIAEVEPLLCALGNLDLDRYQYISFHAPSAYREEEEEHLVELLSKLPEAWPIVLHPDAIYRASRWTALAPRLAIENMDRRKNTGRSVSELKHVFGPLRVLGRWPHRCFAVSPVVRRRSFSRGPASLRRSSWMERWGRQRLRNLWLSFGYFASCLRSTKSF